MEATEHALDEPRRPRLSRDTRIVLGILAAVLVAAVCGGALALDFVGRVASRATCANQLEILGLHHRQRVAAEGRRRDSGGGVPYLLDLWRDSVEQTGLTEPYLLWAPRDPRGRIAAPTDPLDPVRPLERLSSYAARDFGRYPVDASTSDDELLAATRWDLYSNWGVGGVRFGGANRLMVLRLDGSVRWMTRADLGLGPDDPLVIGPESKSPLLRKLCIEPAE